ncbi:MAG TPA: ABC transporter permease, partial [Blastocatellia bacterium]|nr:ABC transporter permease [Blastocatellia bacterium]
MENLLQDFRYSLRTLLRRPGFAVVAVVTLALGIGANTAIFSVINAVLLRPLPYPEPDRLTKVLQNNTEPGKFSNPAFWPYPRFEALRDRNQSLAGVAAYAQRSYNLTGVETPERLDVEFVSAAYFDVLGIKATVGRTFTPGEEIPQGPQGVALISHDLWQRRFGADPGITERAIEIERRSLLIAGVLPAGFKGQSGAVDVWLPMMMVPEFLSKRLLVDPLSYWVHVIARLKPGVTLDQARAEMSILSGEIEKLYPGPAQGRPSGTGEEFIDLVPLREAQVNPVFRNSFLILLAAVGLVVLIACANISNLLLARAVARQKEFAVRLALGASRGRIVRQLLTESATIALAGGSLGLIVALWGIDLLNQFKPIDAGQFWTVYAQTFTLFKVRLDGWVLAFNFLMAALTGMLFGLVPAWQASRPDINPALQGSAGGWVAGSRGPGQRARRLLVVAEIALSLVLLAGAGLMIRSLAKLNAVELGFDPENVITMQVYSRDASE